MTHVGCILHCHTLPYSPVAILLFFVEGTGLCCGVLSRGLGDDPSPMMGTFPFNNFHDFFGNFGNYHVFFERFEPVELQTHSRDATGM